jgi:hypothetical protein
MIDESDLQSKKHSEPRISTLRGIKTDSSVECANASNSIRLNREFDSNVIDESDLHSQKQNDPRISTFIGIMIDSSDVLSNADDSIRAKCEFDSNVIDENDLQCEKHSDPRISTLFGIMIDSSDDNQNAFDSIRVKREFDSKTMSSSCQRPCRETIESGIQDREISVSPCTESLTLSTEPSRTTTRRSYNPSM